MIYEYTHIREITSSCSLVSLHCKSLLVGNKVKMLGSKASLPSCVFIKLVVINMNTYPLQ